jgi:two-component system response regulator PilR (NtrC family)
MTGKRERILVVDDERAQRDALRQYLTRAGFAVEAVGTGEEAVDLLAHESYALLITDLRLPGIDGLAVVRKAHELNEEVGVLLITAFASVESAIEAIRIGAHDYLLKPLILEEVERKARGLLAHRRLVQENALLRRALQETQDEGELVADSEPMRELMEWVRRAAATRSTVLVTGETGTGKEVVARAIHRQSPTAREPFLAINIAAVPENMIESELFGHEKGAFTGADRRRDGLLRAAGTGIVFVDEIAELSGAVQAKLLRVLESREVQPLGSDASVPFDARIIAATHRDLEKMVADGSFREDLYYRLNVIHLRVPPLRERPEDIPALVRQILKRHATGSDFAVPLVTAEAMRALCHHPWKGNVRELSNVLERALILADEGRIDLEQLPPDVSRSTEPGLDLGRAIEQAERAHISMVLRLCNGRRESAAEELGISPATLYRRLEKLGLKGSHL